MSITENVLTRDRVIRFPFEYLYVYSFIIIIINNTFKIKYNNGPFSCMEFFFTAHWYSIVNAIYFLLSATLAFFLANHTIIILTVYIFCFKYNKHDYTG